MRIRGLTLYAILNRIYFSFVLSMLQQYDTQYETIFAYIRKEYHEVYQVAIKFRSVVKNIIHGCHISL